MSYGRKSSGMQQQPSAGRPKNLSGRPSGGRGSTRHVDAPPPRAAVGPGKLDHGVRGQSTKTTNR